MKDIDKYQLWLTKGKHAIIKYFELARFYAQKPWARTVFIAFLVVVGGLTILLKDETTLSFNSKAKQQPTSQDIYIEETHLKEEETTTPKQPTKAPRPHPLVNSIFNFDSIPAHLRRHRPSKEDTTLANTFSNLGFLLNPGLAKRMKVDARVVALKNKKVKDYIDEFAPIAVEEMKKYGIPASITLAQGLLESNVGDSRLARMNNNHFGIKCFSRTCKKGHCSNYTDDSHKDFFRIYPSAWESYREHSVFLQKKRYIHLKKLGTRDYKGWAHGLRKAGYATDKKYGYKLVKIIEALDLQRFDRKA